MAKKDLVEIIKANPGCVATIDNDCWWLYRESWWSENAPNEEKVGHDAYSKWEDQNTLACSGDDLEPLGDGGYGSGHCYGGDILQALAKIVGVKVESV